jgi:hypothetical protein
MIFLLQRSRSMHSSSFSSLLFILSLIPSFHVLIGLPSFLFPCGFHSATCLTVFPSSVRLTWPHHRKAFQTNVNTVALGLNVTHIFEKLDRLLPMLFFWVVTTCGLVGRYQRFGETYCLHLQLWRVRTSSQPRITTTESSPPSEPLSSLDDFWFEDIERLMDFVSVLPSTITVSYLQRVLESNSCNL